MKPQPLLKLVKLIWLPLAVGLVLRLLYLWEYTSSPLFLSPSVDGLYHLEWAKNIALRQMFPEFNQPFFRAPLYPIFLGVLFRLGCNNVVAAVVQAIFSLLTIVIVARITDRIGGTTPAKISAWITACYGPLLSYQLEFQLPVLTVPLFLLFVEFMLSAQVEENKYALPLASLTVGLLAITQANFLIFVPLILYITVRALIKSPRKILIWLALVLWLIPIVRVTYANWRRSHQPVLIASQGGINFYLGNNEKADGAYAVHPELGADWQWEDAKSFTRLKSEPEYDYFAFGGRQKHAISDAVADKRYWQMGLQFWLDQPRKAIVLTIRKLSYLFHHYEIGNNRDLQRFWADRPVTKWLGSEWLFGLIAPIGIAGFLLLRKNKSVQTAAIYGALLLLSYVPFFITARYRLPVTGLLIASASTLLYKIYHHEFTNLQILLPAIVGLVLVWHPFGAPTADPAFYAFTKGNAYLRLQQYEDARTCYKEAERLGNTYPMFANNYGLALMYTGEYKEAEQWLRLALYRVSERQQDKETYDIMDNLAVVYEQERDYEQAFYFYSRFYNRYYRHSTERIFEMEYRLMDSAMVHQDSMVLLLTKNLNDRTLVFARYRKPLPVGYPIMLNESLNELLMSLLREDFVTAHQIADSIRVRSSHVTWESQKQFLARYDRACLILEKVGYPVDVWLEDKIHNQFYPPTSPS